MLGKLHTSGSYNYSQFVRNVGTIIPGMASLRGRLGEQETQMHVAASLNFHKSVVLIHVSFWLNYFGLTAAIKHQTVYWDICRFVWSPRSKLPRVVVTFLNMIKYTEHCTDKPFLHYNAVVLRHHDPRCIQRPVDFIDHAAFVDHDGIVEPPQIPRLQQAVVACCHQQVPEQHKRETDEKLKTCRQIFSWWKTQKMAERADLNVMQSHPPHIDQT